jgi:L-Lysine epsilon oxidase N-terminal/L-lysine epsilon oxidase C-terminal domain
MQLEGGIMAKRYKIHPAIGIARVGTSPEFFLGPETPGTYAKSADGHYRDASKKLRRQAARFWVFEHEDGRGDAAPQPVIASRGIARIEWAVHLVNKKASWYNFAGLVGEGPAGYPPDHPRRNGHITDAGARRKLVINPGPRTLTDRNQRAEVAKGGGGGFDETWPGPLTGGREITSLGTLVTDDEGRLIVAGGYGTSGTIGALPASGRLAYDNNDEWFDDVSDGPVTATIVFADGTRRPVDAPAWIIVGPPDYAPPIENLVTMYDLLYDLGLREFGYDPALFDPATRKFDPGYRPSFTREVYPVLRRAFEYRWVIQEAARHPAGVWDYPLLAEAPSPGEDPTFNPRIEIFDRVRNPDLLNDPANTQRIMPRLQNDGTGGVSPETLRFTVTRTQYEMLRKWAAGQFVPDWSGPPAPAAGVTAAGLDRAALEAGSGGSFFPGIETSWNVRDPRIYQSPFEFRVRHVTDETDATGVTAGDMTKRSALPWQADFLKCGNNWWPAQRPDQVRAAPSATGPVEWARGITSHVDLVERWASLGVVIPAASSSSPAKFHESERDLP